jgi:hypothetical protein
MTGIVCLTLDKGQQTACCNGLANLSLSSCYSQRKVLRFTQYIDWPQERRGMFLWRILFLQNS